MPVTWSGAQAGEGIGHVSAVARPRRSITYEEKVKSEKKRRVVGGEEGAVQAPPPEEKAEPGAAPSRKAPRPTQPLGPQRVAHQRHTHRGAPLDADRPPLRGVDHSRDLSQLHCDIHHRPRWGVNILDDWSDDSRDKPESVP